MAPTRRSTRAKSTDQGVAGLSPPTKATRARPATKTNPPAAKPRTKPTRKAASKAQTVVETEEKEEDEDEEVQEELKPRAKITRKGAAKTHTVPTAEKEEEEKGEIVSQEEIEDIVAAATRRSNLATAIASLQSPTKSKASRGRVTKKVAPARKTRGAVVEDEEAVVADVEAEDVAVPIKSSQGRKPLVEAANSPAPTEIVEAVVVRSRTGRGNGKKSKNPIGEPVVAESSLDASATPSWAKKRGGRKTKILEDGAPDANVVQRTEGETEVVGVDDVGAKDAEPELVVAEGGERKETVVESGTAIEVAEPEPIPKGRGGRRGKKVDAVAEATAETTAVVVGVEPVLKGRGKKGGKVDVVPQEPEAVIDTVNVAEPGLAVIEDTTAVKVAEPEPAPKGRASRRGKKIDVPQEHGAVVETVVETVVEDTVSVAEPEPAAKGRASRRGKKVDVVPQEPEAVIEDTVSVAKPELALKGRASRRSKKVDSIPDNTEVNPELAVAKEKRGKKVAEDTESVIGEPGSVVEEPQPAPVKGGGRRGGRKVDTVVEESEPVLAGGRGRKRDEQAIQEAEITDTNVNQQTAAETGSGVGGADVVVGDIEATSQETQIVGDTEVEVAEEPAVKSRGRKGKKAATAKKSTRKGRKVAVELPDVEMGDTDVQTQETEVDVGAEPIAITGPNVKDSGVFLEEEPIIEEPSVDKLEPIAEGSDAAVEEPVVVTEAEIEIVAQDSNAIAEQEPIAAMQSEVTVEVEVITAQSVAVESNTGQTRAITEETEVEVPEPLKLFAKSPGSSKKKTPKGKGKAEIALRVEQNVGIGEPVVEGENPGPNIELESAILKSSTDIETPGSDIGIEQETAQARKSRKKVKKSATTIKKERQVKAAAAKKAKGVATSNAQDIVSDIFFDGVPKNAEAGRIGNEGVMIGGKRLIEEAVDEEDEPDLPLPFSSPVTRPTLILSPRRTTPDPDLDPIKTPVPSSPIDRLMSHPLGSSPLRQNNPDSVVLASPRLVTTPSNSPSKKRSTPNTRTPINRLSGPGIPFGRNLEDSRDVRSISTPARGRNSSVASSPIMMPPATPNVVAGDARSPTKQTPTKESEIVRDMLDRVDEPSMLVGSIANINSSPVKNSTPIRAASGFEKSSPVGRLSFGGSDVSQSSPLVGRLQINDPNLLLSSPLAVPSKTFSPTKTQHSSPTRSSPLKHSPLAMGSSGFFGDETVGETSFTSFDGYYGRMGEPDDDEEGEEDYQDQETFEYGEGEEVEEKSDQQQKTLSTTEDGNGNDSVDFDATIDESRLFKLAEKAMLEGDAQAEPEVEEKQEENGEGREKETEVATGMLGHNILTSRVSDFEVSCLEQVHPEFGQGETHVGNVPAEEEANSKKEEVDIGEGGEQLEGEVVEEGNLTFSDVVGGGDSIPSSPILEITSPIKFDYRPTSEIFPSGEFGEEALQEGPFSPIDMDFFGDRSFDTSAADWREDEEEEEEDEEEEEETEPDVNSPGGRLRHFRASSPPNIWPADEERGEQSVDSPVPATSMPWDESDFDFSEEFIRPPSESPEPGDELSFDFSKNIPSLSSPTPEESADNNTEEASPLPTAEGQASSPAVRGSPPVDFQAGGASVWPVAGPRESKAIADTWLGKKGLRPKEEKQSAPEESANNESEEGGRGESEGGGDDVVEMKGGKRARVAEKSVERIKRAKRNSGNGAKVEATVDKGRRQTFGGKPMARPTSPSKRRKSFPEGPTIPDRQSYLYASDPKRILRHWAQHEKDQTAPQSIAPSSPLLSVATNSIVTSPSSNILPKSLVRPSPASVRPRRIRSVSGTAASSLSGPHSSPPSTGGKRKATESLETERASKSSIPVSRRLARPVNNKTQEEVDLVLKNTAHNALYSCKLDYEPVRKKGKRPPSLDHNGVQRLATEARRKRKEAEELGLVLRPGEDEAFVAVGEQDGKKRIKWDVQLVYDFEGDPSEGPRARPDSLPNKSILAAKPRLNLHGNWVPTPGVPPLKLPEELIVVKKIMYQGEGEPIKKWKN